MNSKYFCPILTSFNDDSTINYDDMHSLYDQVLEMVLMDFSRWKCRRIL